MFSTIISAARGLASVPFFGMCRQAYHWSLAFAGAVVYGFPSREIKVIAVTGTKGKSSTVEIIGAILEEAGHRVALTNTVRFKVGEDSRPNLYKMSMPGRFFLQGFLRRAVRAGCDYAVLEMTSQGAADYRHRFIDQDAFVLTNISPEHIEAHGSYESYVGAKVSILADGLVGSGKPDRAAIVNGDDKESRRFLATASDGKIRKISYGLKDAEPYRVKERGIDLTWRGRAVSSPLSGLFNLYNVLAAATAARSQGVSDEAIVRAIAKFSGVKGRVERIEAGQAFSVVVDYAHTPDSLEKLYQVFRRDPGAPRSSRVIAVLGGTGGGRDAWKRAEMGRIADRYCDEIILTDEDPYDEGPEKIVIDVARGIASKKVDVIMDRRLAIREAVSRAARRGNAGDAVLITGKGTDPYIMGPRGSKTPWSDAEVAREEITDIMKGQLINKNKHHNQ